MPDYVRNKLVIHCTNDKIMEKIGNIIFFKNQLNELDFTLQKLLPIPVEFFHSEEFGLIGDDWCTAIWGTKWDVSNSRISESGDTISIFYLTATDSNAKWVEAFCRYLNVTTYVDNLQGDIEISVTHAIYRLYDDFGCKMEWTPEKGHSYMEGEILYW